MDVLKQPRTSSHQNHRRGAEFSEPGTTSNWPAQRPRSQPFGEFQNAKVELRKDALVQKKRWIHVDSLMIFDANFFRGKLKIVANFDVGIPLQTRPRGWTNHGQLGAQNPTCLLSWLFGSQGCQSQWTPVTCFRAGRHQDLEGGHQPSIHRNVPKNSKVDNQKNWQGEGICRFSQLKTSISQDLRHFHWVFLYFARNTHGFPLIFPWISLRWFTDRMDFLGLCRAQNAVDATRGLEGGADGASPIYRVSLPEFAEAGVAMVPGGGKWMFHGCVFLETCFLDFFL